jgi:DNA-binding MarR family transcriptional regulator
MQRSGVKMAVMDKEARLDGTTLAEHPQELRLWLRMLTCTQLIETQVRARLRDQFGTTLARFDLLAQLERRPDGLKMNELSRRLMVTGGNVTATTDQLVAEGLVERVAVPSDRRAFHVRMTPNGRKSFADMALEHERWIVDAFAAMSPKEISTLYSLLGKVKEQSRSQSDS